MTESHDFCDERFRYRGYTSGVYLASVDLDDKLSAKRWLDGVAGRTDQFFVHDRGDLFVAERGPGMYFEYLRRVSDNECAHEKLERISRIVLQLVCTCHPVAKMPNAAPNQTPNSLTGAPHCQISTSASQYAYVHTSSGVGCGYLPPP
jgi:hypothetical protein